MSRRTIETKDLLREALRMRLGGDAIVQVSHAPALAGYNVSLFRSVMVPYEGLTRERIEDQDFLDGILKELHGIPSETA